MSSYIFESITHRKLFPVKVFFAAIEVSNFHWHHDYELVLVLKGSVAMQAGAEASRLRAGDVAIFNSRTVHSLKKTDEPNLCLFVQLHPSLFDSENDSQVYCFAFNSTRPDLRVRGGYGRFVEAMAELSLWSVQEGAAARSRVKSLTYQLVADLFEYTIHDIRQYPSSPGTRTDPDTLVQILGFLDQHCLEDDLEAAVCRQMGMSPKSLYRLLKHGTGYSVSELVRSIKIEKAKVLLKNGDKAIAYIAQECGFFTEMTFYRAFKKETGLTPNEFRQRDDQSSSDGKVQGYLRFDSAEAGRLRDQWLPAHRKEKLL